MYHYINTLTITEIHVILLHPADIKFKSKTKDLKLTKI